MDDYCKAATYRGTRFFCRPAKGGKDDTHTRADHVWTTIGTDTKFATLADAVEWAGLIPVAGIENSAVTVTGDIGAFIVDRCDGRFVVLI